MTTNGPSGTRASEPVCDSCGDRFPGDLAQAQVRGWGHWEGQSFGGSQHSHTICRNCRTIGHKRAIRLKQGFEDEPMF